MHGSGSRAKNKNRHYEDASKVQCKNPTTLHVETLQNTIPVAHMTSAFLLTINQTKRAKRQAGEKGNIKQDERTSIHKVNQTSTQAFKQTIRQEDKQSSNRTSRQTDNRTIKKTCKQTRWQSENKASRRKRPTLHQNTTQLWMFLQCPNCRCGAKQNRSHCELSGP